MTLRSFSIHAHFYQPPREDPISGTIPDEAGAAPYNNWNERIHAECYRPNAELGNFEKISFNVGPTLFNWMDEHHAETVKRIFEQDQANVRRHGVGNAMAQAYNHTILPLASIEDKITQAYWGIADFEHRFGRRPQGFWLPETAADDETLSVLSDLGIEFTILAPWQAEKEDLKPEPYRAVLTGGKSLVVFFYHAGLSGRISFDPSATSDADLFVGNLLKDSFIPAKSDDPQIVVIASDGELYGHHQHFRDYFLARIVDGASESAGLTPTFPALWLKHHSPRQTIKILSNTSWSCHHGVLRWMDECGCLPGRGLWKSYLRKAFDKLGAALNMEYLKFISPIITDPWELRHRYIQVVLGNRSLDDLIHEAAGRRLGSETRGKIGLLLSAQYERQRMFTSCGWFFEDFARIEPRNNVAYAAQAVCLTRRATGKDLAPRAMRDLHKVSSLRTGVRGDEVFRRQLERAEQFCGAGAAQPS